jgi:hypothetical protein
MSDTALNGFVSNSATFAKNNSRTFLFAGLALGALVVVGTIAYQNSQPDFVIGPDGDSLADHLSFQRSIDVAERFKKPLLIGPDERVTYDYDTVRHLEPLVNILQVKVAVHQNDHIDLRWRWSYTSALDATETPVY